MALITLQDAKAFLKVDFADEDALIQSLIDEADAIIKKEFDRDLEQQTYTDEPYNGEGHERIFVRNWPIQAVDSLKIDGQEVDPADYEVSKATGIIKYHGTVPEGLDNVLVSYTGGYPAEDRNMKYFQNKCRLLVADLYEGRGA